MADNRLWLVHRQTGWATCLAKRYDSYYVNDPLAIGESIQKFFELVERDGVIMNDDFCIMHERDGKKWDAVEWDGNILRVEIPGEIPSDA